MITQFLFVVLGTVIGIWFGLHAYAEVRKFQAWLRKRAKEKLPFWYW